MTEAAGTTWSMRLSSWAARLHYIHTRHFLDRHTVPRPYTSAAASTVHDYQVLVALFLKRK